MGSLNDVRAGFLARFCPDPPLIEAAFQRLGLWDVREFGPDHVLCRAGDHAEACWLIVQGQIEIVGAEQSIRFRTVGELVGEQALLSALGGKAGTRTADLVSRGPLKVVCFDAGLQEKLTSEEKAVWALTLGLVVNEKLAEATKQRAEFRTAVAAREALLTRFAEGDALGLVRRAVEEQSEPIVRRDSIIWFSDIANFSTWAADKEPAMVAALVRKLTGAQMRVIRAGEGQIDKLIGDGVMGLWFVDTQERKRRLSVGAVECAIQAVGEVTTVLKSEGLDGILGIRVGLHTGPAMYGDFGAEGRIAVTLLGHDVNLASRYEQAKAAGLTPIRISKPLKELVESSSAQRTWEFGAPMIAEAKHGIRLEIFSPVEKGTPK